MLNAVSHPFPFHPKSTQKATPLIIINAATLPQFFDTQNEAICHWIKATQFKADPTQLLALPDEKNHIKAWVYAIDSSDPLYCLGDLSDRLNEGLYTLDDPYHLLDTEMALLGFALGAYRFHHFVAERKRKSVSFQVDAKTYSTLEPLVQTHYWVRDLINLPAETLGPEQLALEAKELARAYHADYQVIVGDELLCEGYPLIYAVGRASNQAPRLVEMRWGNPTHPLVSLIGKGVCFDSGGLDLKSADGLALMKKDMGGAAHALGLARLIMHHNLPIRLQILLPIVENAVSGNAYRPGDILMSRKGLSIEITNTDAEGRLILADALTRAMERADNQPGPSLVLDFATLTGAARVALGPQIPAFFSNSDALSQALMKASAEAFDPIWPLPLFAPYKKMIRGKFSDLINSSSGTQAGAITAALFLQSFVNEHTPWAHFDLMGWNPSTTPGRPEGGEAMTLRTAFRYLTDRYGY